MTTLIPLIDNQHTPLGEADKTHIHKRGLCHPAFSVFLLRRKEGVLQMLLQQRAATKYHCPNLWANACCSHPPLHAAPLQSAQNRLQEELGVTAALQAAGSFHYIAHFENGLTENEIDHVCWGWYEEDDAPFNPAEVQAIHWMSVNDLKQSMLNQPKDYAPWLAPALAVLEKHFEAHSPA